MAYTTIKKPSDYFNTKTYSGNASTQAITGINFQSDMVWTKARSGTYGTQDHAIIDVVRGVTKTIRPNQTSTEGTETNTITSFDTDGYTIGGDNGKFNQSSTEYVSWNWLANGTGVANTDGSISSTVSANTTSGFSVVSYTGNNASGATVGHGLSSAPKMVIGKAITSSGEDWFVGHSSIGFDKYLKLNTTDVANTTSVIFNNTAPSNSVVTLGNNGAVNSASYNYIMYCFEEKQGFSKFGSYVGNGNVNGTFVYTGFKPAFVIIRQTNISENWLLLDNKRDIDNTVQNTLLANTNNSEFTGTDRVDFLSNGFKCRTATGGVNASGGTHIYMAFAEEPLVGDNPATAR